MQHSLSISHMLQSISQNIQFALSSSVTPLHLPSKFELAKGSTVPPSSIFFAFFFLTTSLGLAITSSACSKNDEEEMDDDAAEEWVDPAAARRAGVASSSLAYAVSMSDDAVVKSRARVLASFMMMLF